MDPPANTEIEGVGKESTVALATLETQGDSQMEVDQAIKGADPGPETMPDARKQSVTEETSILNQTEDETIVVPTVAKKKFLNIQPAETVPKNFAAYLDDSTASDAAQEESLSPDESLLKSAPTSVIVAPKPNSVEEAPIDTNGKLEEEPASQEQEKAPVDEPVTEDTPVPAEPVALQPPPKELLDLEEEQATVTVADLVEEAEKKEEPTEEVSAALVSEAVVEEIVNTPLEETSVKTLVEEKSVETPKVEKPLLKSPGEDKEKYIEMEASPLTQNPKAKKSQAVKLAAKAAEIQKDWSDGEEEEEGSANNVTIEAEEEEATEAIEEIEAALKSPPKQKLLDDAKTPEFTPRKSGRAPKPTEKKLESQQQENLKAEDMEESVDAIAKELEKTDTEVNKSGKKDSKSPKKGKKGGRQQGENKEDWVTLIFGENGEKVTEKGKKKGAEIDDKDELDIPEAEEFLMDQTPFQSKDKTKKSGRPRKKDLDEKMDGVAKLGSNMYFYTGPGGGQGGREESPSLSDDEEKGQVESKRMSGRAGKGRNPRLEREDEVVDLPQVKAKEASLNPSWLKNHDGKTPVKKIPTAPSTPVTSKNTAVSIGKKKTSVNKEKEEAAVTAAAEEIAAAMENKEEGSRTPVPKKSQNDLDAELPEFDPEKFTPGYVPKTVKKGDDEYMIVVQGVSDTGLCGNYWGNTSLPSRRRSKAPETLQLGSTETPPDTNSRRGSVASVSSTETPTGRKRSQSKKTPATTPIPKETPKSHKKQVTKPEKKPEPMDSSQSESEPEPESAKRGRKRKADVESPAKEAKKEKKDQTVEDEDLKATFSDYDSAGGTENTTPLRTTKRPSSKESPAKDKESKESPLTSKQQTAVNAALAAGVPAGQQRSVSCVADTSTQREVVVECFAPYDDHRWVNIGKERDGMAPDAVQYARALRPPYHLLSFLRIKGHSTKGMSCTDKNTMVFVVLEGEITVILHTTQFNAKKGDSFYIPPKNYYNLINQKAREAELSLIQFQYDGPLPTVQPAPGSS